MSLGAYLKSSVWEFALLLVSCWCLGVVIMDGFYVDEWLQFGAAPLLSTAVLLLALYLAAWRHDRMPVGIVATVVVVAVLVGGSMALSTAGSSYDDVFGNYLWAAVVVVLCTLAGFALTRTLAGAGAWFVVCIFLCSLVQALFETGRVGFPFAVLVTALAMVVYRNFRIGFGSIIADDMGLGKTLQVITLLQKLKDDGALGAQATHRQNNSRQASALIVVPTGLVTNWQAELARFAPQLTVFTYHGPGRNLKEFKDADILLTTYGVLRSDVTELKKLKWLTVIINEDPNNDRDAINPPVQFQD